MENEVTLLDLLWALRRAFLRLLLLALGVGLGVYALSLLLPKRYESAASARRASRAASRAGRLA